MKALRQHHKLFCLLLLTILIFGITNTAYALEDYGITTPSANNPSGNDETDQGGTFERIIAGVVEVPCTVIEGLLRKGGFKPLDELVFMQGLSETEKKNLPWDGKEPEYVQLWFQSLLVVSAPFYIIAIIVTAFKFFYAANKPESRAEAIESIQRWFLSIGIVVAAPIIVSTIMLLSGLAVDAITGAFQSVASSMGRSVGDWRAFGTTGGTDIVTGSVLGTAIVRLFMMFMFAYLNCLYIIRKLALTVFFVFTPVCALVWAINKKTTAMVIWLGEIASNAFMPVAHALVLCTVLLLCDVKDMGGSWVTILIMLYSIVPIAEAIRDSFQSLFARWAGVNEQGIARGVMAAAMGFAGIMSMSRVARASFGNPAESVKASLPVKSQNFQNTGSHQTRQIGFGSRNESGPTMADNTVPIMASNTMRPIGFGTPVESRVPTGQIEGQAGWQIGDIVDPVWDKSHSSKNRGSQRRGSTNKISYQPVPELSPQEIKRLTPYQRAVEFGTAAGYAASMIAAGTLGLVGGTVPGGAILAYPAARAAGAVTRVAATGLHMAGLGRGSDFAKQKFSEKVTPLVRNSPVGKRVLHAKESSQKLLNGPGVRHIVKAGQGASLAIKTGFNPNAAMRKARYIDTKNAGLNKLDIARQR